MMQRTIAEAEAVLDALSGLSEDQRRTCQGELTTARAEATRVANEMATRSATEVAERRADWLADLCSVRDDFAALRAEGELGRIRAADYEARLRRLQARQRQAERSIAQVTERMALVEAIEEDPLAYGDQLLAKFPQLLFDFSF